MISDIAHQLKELWIFDYHDLRVIDVNTYAINLHARNHETKVDFIDRVTSVVTSIERVYKPTNVSIDFSKPMFTIIEFEVKG